MFNQMLAPCLISLLIAYAIGPADCRSSSSDQSHIQRVNGGIEEIDARSDDLSSRLLDRAVSSKNIEYPCNIRKVYDSEAFLSGTLDISSLSEPVIFVRNSNYQSAMASIMHPDRLLQDYNDLVVRLSSSNTYSRDILEMPLGQYLELIDSYNVGTAANETFYLFGGNMGEFWDELIASYRLPGCKYCAKAGAVTPGLGGLNSGVSFHYHGPGFSETIFGGKRWFLYPPDKYSGGNLAPMFGPNMTMASWVSDVYPTLTEDLPSVTSLSGNSNDNALNRNKLVNIGASEGSHLYRPLECVIYPGEVLFFPNMWSHATLNVDKYTVFVSVFLDPSLMTDDR